MRKLFLPCICLLLLVSVFSCRNNNNAGNNANRLSPDVINIPASADNPHPAANGTSPKIVFTDTNFDFGSITEGDIVTHIFIFKNNGHGDLVIASVTASCGCTIPSCSRQVKHPGDTGSIKVTFNSTKKSGKLEKLITVVSNAAPPCNYLTINANIQPLNK